MTLESRIDHLEGRMVPHTQKKSDKNQDKAHLSMQTETKKEKLREKK
jgi:hypothetical protein